MTDRSDYIGSSDAIDILRTNWDRLWKEKTGRLEPKDLSDVFRVQLGVHTEPFHINWTVSRLAEERAPSGEKWVEMPKSRQLESQDSELPYVLGHIDAMIIDEAASDKTVAYPLEVKHSSGRRSMEELIQFYMPQFQHHMMTTDADKLLFSAILANDEPVRAWIGRSEDYIAELRRLYAEFWALVQADTPPALPSNPETLITPDVKDAIPIDGMVRRDGSKSNAFMDLANIFVETKAARDRHEKAKKEIKDLVAPNEQEVYSPILTLKRNAKGNILIKEIAA